MSKKGLLVGATAFGLTLSGAGISSVSAADSKTNVHASSVSGIHSSLTNQEAAKTLNNIYDQAYIGQMPREVHGLTVHKSTKEDVHQKLGEPEEPATKDNPFDRYHGSMGNPSYAISYDKNDKVNEIRNFGTNVERQTNLGGITPAVLSEQIGSPDKILDVPDTNELDYVYKTDDYELHFVIGDNPIIKGHKQTVNHVNLKAAK
ncbi:YjgB family protein [Virgibacillus halophilus]|uniref:YjgB family protein n=1 Tax=Tigheibacillus halophilus TaxID=361280 RepID=A0ABU5C9J9_9BACI|nr:YjgB family protein [Virgibacillus halophilus]